MLTRRSCRARGMTLVEILAALMIVLIVAAITIPAVKSRMTAGYGQALSAELSMLGQAVQTYHSDVGKYPPSLDYLSVLPASPTDLCGTALTAASKGKWRGPYTSRTIPTAGSGVYYLVNDDTIDIALSKNFTPPPSMANRNFLQITIQKIEQTTATVVDQTIDGGTTDFANGVVLWTQTTGAGVTPVRGTLTFQVPTWGC
jgi:prepilin-type N-terminal cleavage/methylation domain-containing protein